jgi:hypothetical protein
MPACIARCTPFSFGMFTIEAESPASTMPGAQSCFGIAQ